MKAVKTDRTCSYNIREAIKACRMICECLEVSGDLGEGSCAYILTSGSSNGSVVHDQTYRAANIKLMNIELETTCREAVVV
jgi:hypothetical protein